jgi:hypothetical protein
MFDDNLATTSDTGKELGDFTVLKAFVFCHV